MKPICRSWPTTGQGAPSPSHPSLCPTMTGRFCAKASDKKKYGPVFITMAWEIPQLEKVNYELWTSSEDHNGAEFKRDFQEVVDLIERTNFRPRYFIYDGDAQGCTRPGLTCQTNVFLMISTAPQTLMASWVKDKRRGHRQRKFKANVHLEGSDRWSHCEWWEE